MADFGVTAVRYNSERTHITFVRVSEDLPTKLGTPHTVARGFVADLIRMKKATFKTWMKDSDGKYVPGADIHVLEDQYLSTDRNSKTRDNLGALPEF